MFVLGLTGSLAMGKTTAAGTFTGLGVPVFDSDAVVHDILQKSARARKAIKMAFPGAFVAGEISRLKLGEFVFSSPAKLRQLEGILHPPFMARMRRFIDLHRKKETPVIVLDVPLLYETGVETVCDAVVVVTADATIQKKRALSRADMTKERLYMILERQMPDEEKRRRADYVVSTNGPKPATRKILEGILSEVQAKAK